MSPHHRGPPIYHRLQQVPDALLFGIIDYESTSTWPASLRDSDTASATITAADLSDGKKDLHMQCRSSHRMSYRKWRLALVFEVQKNDRHASQKAFGRWTSGFVRLTRKPCQGWTAKDSRGQENHIYMSKDGSDAASRTSRSLV